MEIDNRSLGGQEQENKTDNFGPFLLGRVELNWMMNSDRRSEVTNKCI